MAADPALILEVSHPELPDLFVPFLSANTSTRLMQATVNSITRHIVITTKSHDPSLAAVTLIPVLRGGFPMYVTAQPLFSSSCCILVRCHKTKGTNKSVEIEWLGCEPLPRQLDNGTIVILDTVVASGDTILALCNQLQDMLRRS
jgi:4a-hydroxytetrahydrobiopterin dehydratase